MSKFIDTLCLYGADEDFCLREFSKSLCDHAYTYYTGLKLGLIPTCDDMVDVFCIKCYYEGVEGVGVYEQMLKAGLRFPLSSLHHELLKYLGLSVNQISPNTWRVFIAIEVLYNAMTDGARRLTVKEFLHCYHMDEIDKSTGMYSFVPKSPLLKVIYETPDSNKDWKNYYFFLEGDDWMCRLGDTEHMPVDTTWGILH